MISSLTPHHLVRAGIVGEVHDDLIAFDRDFVGRHRSSGGKRERRTGYEREEAAVLPALDRALLDVDFTDGERVVLVRADVVDRVHGVATANDADRRVTAVDAPRHAVFETRERPDGDVPAHTAPLSISRVKTSRRYAAQPERGHLVEEVVEEAEQDQPIGDLCRHAPTLEVETLLGVDRTDRRGVRAADVVLLDVEIGNRVGVRALGEHEVAIGLRGDGTAGALGHVDHAAVDRAGVVAHRALEDQVARRPPDGVLLEGPEILHLGAFGEIGRGEPALGALADEIRAGEQPRRTSRRARRRTTAARHPSRPCSAGRRAASRRRRVAGWRGRRDAHLRRAASR